MSTAGWTSLWWWWLLAVLLSWAALEGASLVFAHLTRQKHIVDWTLSDTIRRWSSARSWLAPLAIGTACGLLWHFFGQPNPV